MQVHTSYLKLQQLHAGARLIAEAAAAPAGMGTAVSFHVPLCALTYLEKKKKGEGEHIEFREMNQLA